MLSTHLNNFPYTRLIIIEDSVEERGKPMLVGLVKNRAKVSEHEINYFVFEGNYGRTRNSIPGTIAYHDFVSDTNGWINPKRRPDFEAVISTIKKAGVLVIDSLAHFLYAYGFKETYRILNDVVNNNRYVLQTLTVLHSDLLETTEAIPFFRHLSTLYVSLDGSGGDKSRKPRASYVFKKYAGKIIKATDEYEFGWGGVLKTEPVKRVDAKRLVQDSIEADDLTTFKISLGDEEKKARDDLVLPYLPKDESERSGKIIYQLDDVDDWDEEDPDDDLDI